MPYVLNICANPRQQRDAKCLQFNTLIGQPLFDVGHVKLTRKGHVRRISRVAKHQIQVMSTVLEDDGLHGV